ncbi:amino acid permease [Iodidimonas sp. SYSU 1G8]|uniref:amino acid permease n=1 Tax=Iodidimonas sp. SYSU 1G8 TaxID=3133967 RepID=UPI0031FE7CCB
MSDIKGTHGVSYKAVDDQYFQKRGLRRYAGVFSLWALGVGAVISGDFSGWNFGLGFGWGSMFVAAIIITVMYLGLTYSIAEMSPALPHTGGAYSFARSAMGPWGGFVTGIAENIEYILTPAVIVFFIGSYVGAILGTDAAIQPLYWVIGYLVFLGLNLFGVELSFRVTVVVTLVALAVLAVFFVSAIPSIDFSRWALNIGVGPDGTMVALPEGGGPWFPDGVHGVLGALPFAVWLFLAIEQLPLAAEEAVDPKRDMPRGILLGIFTLIFTGFGVLFFNASIGPGSWGLKESGEPLLDGFRTIYGTDIANLLSLAAILGLIASFHAIMYAFGRQIYSLSRAGYFPRGLSITHGTHKTPYLALIFGSLVGLGVMLVIWFLYGAETGGAFIGAALLNMAVFGAMLSYVYQGISFILLRINMPHIERPFRSPFGIPGALATILIGLVTIYFQITDPAFRAPVIAVAIYYAVMILYFALIGRHHLVLSPEEEFAMTKGASGGAH